MAYSSIFWENIIQNWRLNKNISGFKTIVRKGRHRQKENT